MSRGILNHARCLLTMCTSMRASFQFYSQDGRLRPKCSVWVSPEGLSSYPSSKKCPKHESRKNQVLVITDPSHKIIIFFSILYQCWLNSQKIFFACNPWFVNNVRHFAKTWFWSKFMPQLREFTCSLLQERGASKSICFILLVLCTGQFVKIIYKLCA